MHRRILLTIPCTMAVVLSACFLKPQGQTLKTQLEESRIKMSRVESSLQRTAAQLEDAEKARIQCTNNLNDLQIQHTDRWLPTIPPKAAVRIGVLKLFSSHLSEGGE